MTGNAAPSRGVRFAVTLIGAIAAIASGAFGGPLAGGPPAASGATGGAPAEAGMSGCPSSTAPNQLTLVAGTPQTTTLGAAFATALQVALTNSDGCPVTSGAAGVAVTFSAPGGGPSGVFASSGTSSVTVGSDDAGAVTAPAFTADDTPGSYTLSASSPYGAVSFSLTNTAAGVPASITAPTPRASSASVNRRYPAPLQVRVLDANGNPVAGASVTFTLGSGSPSACGTNASAGASFIGSSAQATATTGESGMASSPPFVANGTSGSLTATAAISGGAAAGSGAAGSGAGATALQGVASPVSFSLRNRAGKPTKLTAGLGSVQSTPAGARFPLRLAVTLIDAEKNPVPGALVTFSAPTHGASGRFARSRDAHTAKVRTDACGIAVAPAFTAGRQRGGYVVKASVPHVRTAAFALVNAAGEPSA